MPSLALDEQADNGSLIGSIVSTAARPEQTQSDSERARLALEFYRLETVEKERPFRVEMNKNPEGPFYRVELRGGQVMLLINTAHRFYTDVYAAVHGPEGARIRQALEVLLFVLGKSEVYATDERNLFYVSERQEWSKQLDLALAKLGSVIDMHPEALEEIEQVTIIEE